MALPPQDIKRLIDEERERYKSEFNKIDSAIDMLINIQKEISDHHNMIMYDIRRQCEHVDDGYFMYGSCMICGEYCG